MGQTKVEKNQTLQIRTTVFIEEQKVSMKEEIDEIEDSAIHFLGYENNLPVAASRLRWLDDYGKLERVCILKEHRGQSYGTDMINRMELEVTNKGYTKTKLNAQTREVDIFKRF